jgi:deoxyribodipyrimidine photo-lyase
LNNLIWFRNNLRTTDNISLSKACAGNSTIAVYYFDPRDYQTNEFGFKKTEKYRAKFLIESIDNLKLNLTKLNIPFYIIVGKPEDSINELISQHQIDRVYLQAEWTRDENKVLKAVKKSITKKVAFIASYDQFLFQPEDIPFSNFDLIPDVYTSFRKQCEKQAKIRIPQQRIKAKPKENYIAIDTSIPLLKDLGLEDFAVDSRTAFPFKGGGDEALKRLNYYLWDSKKIATYKKTRNGLVGKDYSSKLSAWLANGSISPVTIYWAIKDFERQVVKNQDTYWLIFELIWRDYFKYISLKYKSKIFKQGGILDTTYQWNNSDKVLESWINGNTKEPFVNANMIELLKTGWMSNRGRQNVASYWSKELKQDWRIGAAYMESILLDYDVHSNWCNWMYNSGVGNDPRDRKFNITRQADMYDSNKTFQQLWLQESLF